MDIDSGNGLCLIDSSDNGQTVKDVLAYCAYKNHKRVLFIDPLFQYLKDTPFWGKVVPIDLFGDYPDESADKVWDVIQIQFQQKDQSETPVIKQYLPAIIRVLHKAGLTLAETIYFTDPAYIDQRENIFSMVSDPTDHDVVMLRSAFKNPQLYKEFRPTGRRILDVLNHSIEPMFACTTGLDFKQLIRDGWVILVNLYPKKSFGRNQARFLGTAIINEFSRAIDDLVASDWIQNKGWKGRYYIYVDEGGRYANTNLADLLSYKGKTGLQLIFSHHYLTQIRDTEIRDAILNQTSTKVVFQMENPNDANVLAKIMYGGEVKDRDASYYFKNLQPQECVIKIPGLDATKVRVPDVKDVPENVNVKEYLERIYSQGCYISIEDIRKEQSSRFNPVVYYQTKPITEKQYGAARTSHTSSKPRTQTAKKPVSKATAPRQSANREEQANVFSELREDQVSYPANEEKQPPEK